MDSELPRFECRREEESGTWMVWDRSRQQVAEIGGCPLRGREEHRARVACTILTRIYRNRDGRRPTEAFNKPASAGTESEALVTTDRSSLRRSN
jgi:hypothetical protein